MICNLGKEAWRSKEARATEDEEPAWGDAAKRGVLWEADTAITLAMAGADVLVMRHPDAVASSEDGHRRPVARSSDATVQEDRR